ncbi:unnamed protein product [Staurois parvus]|uniref:G-protein coupled receptors family 1 profile domain-containing protein n=1 Tax=Staurois parvus TaxID=386267 RepID=A0ABN9B0V2_9NEOB|nr:unnamed protein product [Staurois parvus]
MYIISIAGNSAVITLVKVGTSLHCPMYFFISAFAALEISFVSVTIPKLLTNLIAADRRISFTNCFVQLCLQCTWYNRVLHACSYGV